MNFNTFYISFLYEQNLDFTKVYLLLVIKTLVINLAATLK